MKKEQILNLLKVYLYRKMRGERIDIASLVQKYNLSDEEVKAAFLEVQRDTPCSA